MKTSRLLPAVLAGLLAVPAMAQTDAPPPLNLKLPAHAVPAAPRQDAAPAHGGTAPGVYYGDTSGTTDAALAANDPDTGADACDDATYNKTQVHGSIGMGVMSGSHASDGTARRAPIRGESRMLAVRDRPTRAPSTSPMARRVTISGAIVMTAQSAAPAAAAAPKASSEATSKSTTTRRAPPAC